MAGYFIARVTITNPEKYKKYMKHTPACMAKYGGRFIVRGAEPHTLDGPTHTERLVVAEFRTKEDVIRFYDSHEYQAVKKLRDGAADAQFFAVDGLTESAWQSLVEESSKHTPPY